MNEFKMLPHVCLSCLILLQFVANVAAQVSRTEVNVTSTVDQYKGACPGETVVFTCTAFGSQVKWTSTTLIGVDQRIQFNAHLNEIGEGMVQTLPNEQRTFAQLIYKDNVTITTQLRITIPADARRSTSLLVTCTKEDMPEYSNMSNRQVAGMISAPQIISEPILLYHDPTTGTTSYNLSWFPPSEAVLFDISYYEITIGELKRSTRDTYLTFFAESDTVLITVTVVDRCNRRSSAAMNFTSTISPTKVSGFAYAYITVGFLTCIVAFCVFMPMRMAIFCFTEKLRSPGDGSPEEKGAHAAHSGGASSEEKTMHTVNSSDNSRTEHTAHDRGASSHKPKILRPTLKFFMYAGTVASTAFFVATLCILIYTVIQQDRQSSFLFELHFTYLLLALVSFAIEFVGMMVLGFIMYTRLEEVKDKQDSPYVLSLNVLDKSDRD